MMQTAEPWHSYNSATCRRAYCCFTTLRRSLRQSEMRPVFMVVTDVFGRQAFQMTSSEDDYMVEQVSKTASNPALGNTVLPRTPETSSFRLDAQCFDRTYDFLIEVRSSIEDQILWREIAGECFSQLLSNPRTVRMLGDIAMQNFPSVMCDDEETIEHAECERRHYEEIHCGDSFPMIAQKGRPLFRRLRVSRRFPHPAQDSSFRNVEAKHRKFSVDAGCAPGWVLGNHADDKLAQLLANTLPAWTGAMSRKPSPIRFESGSMPSYNRLRLDENQRLLPSGVPGLKCSSREGTHWIRRAYGTRQEVSA